MKKKLEREISELKHEEYFPYIHGDLIEEQRQIMNHHMKEELKADFKEKMKTMSHSADRVSKPRPSEHPIFFKPHRP